MNRLRLNFFDDRAGLQHIPDCVFKIEVKGFPQCADYVLTCSVYFLYASFIL